MLAAMLAGCALESPAAIDVVRLSLIPESVSRLAVTVISPDPVEAVRCGPEGRVEVVGTGVYAGATAALSSEALGAVAELTGPVELTRGEAEGAVVDGVPTGTALVFVEGFDGDGRAVVRACGGPVAVRPGATSEVELVFAEL
jgi:hypothetical protein